MAWAVALPAFDRFLLVHLLFESLAYFVGFRVFLHLRSRWGDPVGDSVRWTVVAAAALGALAGSRILGWIDHPVDAWAHRADPAWLLGGKTIVGALLGGTAAVEWAKHLTGERRSTGDLFALPLCVGMAIGRIGCLLAGLADRTYGTPTRLPWGIDFGDGIPRHPAQLYEIVALLGIAAWVWHSRTRVGEGPGFTLRPGDLFRGFMVLYLAFRLAVDVIKAEPRPYLGLSGIQVACLVGLLYYAPQWGRLVRGTWRPGYAA